MSRQPTSEQVVVIGLGYVGLTLSAYLAQKGMHVHGVEIRGFILDRLKKYQAFFLEKNLDAMLADAIKGGFFSFSDKIPVSTNPRIFIITVGTPLDAELKPNLDFIKSAAKQVAHSLSNEDLVILRSTVKLGVTNEIVRDILGQSNKKFGLAFCPERTLEGAALSEIGQLPQIVGADSKEDLNRATDFFKKITPYVVQVSNIETAEMIKLVDNMQRDTHFAISNEVARMCNQVEIKASEVISAGKYKYPRTNLPTPGPVGGPCLEKDTYLLNSSFQLPFSLSKTARKVNEVIVDDSLDYFQEYFGSRILKIESGFGITIIGLAFKGVPETNDLRGSVGLRIISAIKQRFPSADICGFDPVVSQQDILNLNIRFIDTYEKAFEKRDLVLLMNNHPTIAGIEVQKMAGTMNPLGMVYDFWGRFDDLHNLPNGVVSSSWGSHGINLNKEVHE
jgi:UDP-N-acetyl-D-mannosaminuronic acid dehydrogenase